MTAIIAIWHFLVRALVRIATTLHLYRLKSMLYRLIFERGFRDVKLSVWHSFDDIANFILPETWRADSWETLFDAVSYPGKAQLVFEGKLGPTKNFDCDEFAIWLTATLERCKNAGTLNVSGVGMMSCIWAEDGFKIKGHNVCLFRMPTGFYVMDYRMPLGPYETPAEAARDVVLGSSTGEFGVPLVMCVHDHLLRPLGSEAL